MKKRKKEEITKILAPKSFHKSLMIPQKQTSGKKISEKKGVFHEFFKILPNCPPGISLPSITRIHKFPFFSVSLLRLDI